MWGSLAFRVLPLLFSSVLAATLPELFQKAKTEFKLGRYAATLETLDELERESLRSGREAQRSALRPGLLFYRGASLAALGRPEEAQRVFSDFLSYEPNAQADPAVFPRPVITALESARESRPRRPRADEGTSLAEAYRAFPRPEPGEVEKPGEDWAEGPVRHLLTSQERRNFAVLADPIARSEFVTNFWKARNPKPESAQDEFRREFEKRVAFADSRFSQDETRGSLTDRGMVFILLGPPSYSGRKALKTGDDAADASGLSRFTRSEVAAARQPAGSNATRQARIEQVTGPTSTILDAASNWIEFWHYRGNLPRGVGEQEVVFEFVTKAGYGRNVLQRDPAALATLARAAGRKP
jgi:GWxTD domain-containing protein